MGYNLETYYVEYHHNNSGGFDWMHKEDWQKLLNNGWKVYIENESEIYTVYKKFKAKNGDNARKNAIKDWQKILNMNPYSKGCECCGPPHRFMILDAEDVKEILEES